MSRRENVLLGVVLGIAFAHVIPGARAESPKVAGERAGEMIAVAVNGGQRDTLFLIDPSTNRLAVYRVKDNAFASRPGYPVSAASLQTSLHVAARVRAPADPRGVWVDVHFFDAGTEAAL